MKTTKEKKVKGKKVAEAEVKEVAQKQNDLEIVSQYEQEAKATFESVVITNDEELAGVSDKIKFIKDRVKEVEALKEKFTGPAKAIIAQAKEIYDGFIAYGKNAEKDLKQRAQGYMIEQENIKEEERKKIAAQLENKSIDTGTAIEQLNTLPQTEKSVSTGASQLSMKKVPVAEIADANLIPDEFWVVDETRVKKEAMLRHKNGLPQIPGMKIEMRIDMSSR